MSLADTLLQAARAEPLNLRVREIRKPGQENWAEWKPALADRLLRGEPQIDTLTWMFHQYAKLHPNWKVPEPRSREYYRFLNVINRVSKSPKTYLQAATATATK